MNPTSPEPESVARYSIVVNGTEIASSNHLIQMTRQLGTRPTIELKGASEDMTLDNWFQRVKENPSANRRTFDLIVSKANGDRVARYVVTNGEPSMIRVAGTSAGSFDMLHQEVTFTAESVQRLSPR